MDNRALAAVFLEMGELLQIQGGDPYRARAFKRTAQILEGVREPVAEKLKHGGLARIPGIGPGSVDRIKSILATGTCPDHQRLLARLPQGLRDVVKVRGMGPRHARLAFETLGVRDLEGLARAARSGALLLVPGIGARTVERVLAHLDDIARGPAPRLRLDDAVALGEQIIEHMREEPACVMLAQTGSARRKKETVGDLDVLVATRQPGPVVRRFTVFPDVKEVILAGDSRATVILRSGVQVDLRVVTAETFGAGLHYFTGNKQHNIQMRLRANQHRLQLSEHGVWERKLFGRGQGEDNRKIARRIVAGRTEEEIFLALGLPFIPPELREGDGEIEAAAAGKLPRLVDAGDLQGDLHLRARSLAEASAMLHAAKAAGLAYVCFVRTLEELRAPDAESFAREVALVEETVGVRALLGALVPIAVDGGVDGARVDELRERVDLVVGVVEGERAMPAAQMTARVVKAVTSGAVDVLHHPTGRVLLPEDDDEPGLDVEIWTVLKAAARARVLIEVGGDPRRLDLDARGCRTNTEVGALLSVASEATAPEQMAPRLGYALGQARRGWIGKELVGNSLPLERLEAWLRERRAAGAAPSTARRAMLQGWVADNPLARALDDTPLPPELVERLERFLQGEADPPLERALARSAGNALQRAFDLVMRARGA